MDLLCFEASDLSAYLLDPTYADMLNEDERELRDALEDLRTLRARGARGPGWDRIAQIFEEFHLS